MKSDSNKIEKAKKQGYYDCFLAKIIRATRRTPIVAKLSGIHVRLGAIATIGVIYGNRFQTNT